MLRWLRTRVHPHCEAGMSLGLMIDDLGEGTFLRAADLHNNDVITKINGKKIDAISTLIKMYKEMKNESKFQIHVVRNGREKVLTYRMQ